MQKKYLVTGMHCAACVANVETAVKGVLGVDSCSLNLLTGNLKVEGDFDSERIKSAVLKAGYGIKDDTGTVFSTKQNSKGMRAALVKIVVCAVISLVIMFLSMGHMLGIHVLAGIPVLRGVLSAVLALTVIGINYKFFVSGALGLMRRAPNMDTLVSLGSAVSFLYSVYAIVIMALYGKEIHLYFDSAAMILTFISIGKLLEGRAKIKTGKATEGLINLMPSTVSLLRNGVELTVPINEASVGELFVVKPGERIACDGVVVAGRGAVDQSTLTGESVPIEKNEGDKVFAATVNRSGNIVCQITSTPDGTVLAGILKSVNDAAATKAPIARIADKMAAVFVPVVLLLSLLTFFGWLLLSDIGLGYAVERAIAVLVISCPCALGLATPVAITVGIGVGASHGILFKGAPELEMAGKIKTVALDKTGTVTLGKMSVFGVYPFGVEEEYLLSLALALEAKSEHPIAVAITEKVREMGIAPAEITDFSSLDGRGVYGKIKEHELYGVSYKYASELTNIGSEVEERYNELSRLAKTAVLFLYQARVIGIIALSDSVRPGSKESIAALYKMGYRTVMLTGDNKNVAKAVADEAGVQEVWAELLPVDKADVVKKLRDRDLVCMVGDGINDAPALIGADLGMAIGQGTDIAIDTAGVVLVGSEISDVVNALHLGRRTLRCVKQNLLFAFIYNLIGIPLAMGILGLSLPPMFGALAMSLSSFTVVSNALRINLWRPIKKEIQKMQKQFNVKGMMCPHCEGRVREALEKIDGVISAAPSHKKKRVIVELGTDVADEIIVKAIEDAGYTVF